MRAFLFVIVMLASVLGLHAQEESASPAAMAESVQQDQHQSMTVLDAVAEAKERAPETIKAPDRSGRDFLAQRQRGRKSRGGIELGNVVPRGKVR